MLLLCPHFRCVLSFFFASLFSLPPYPVGLLERPCAVVESKRGWQCVWDRRFTSKGGHPRGHCGASDTCNHSPLSGYSLNDCPQLPRRPAWIFPWILIGSPWRRKREKGGKKSEWCSALLAREAQTDGRGKTLPFFFTVGCETMDIFRRRGGGVARQLARRECSD